MRKTASKKLQILNWPFWRAVSCAWMCCQMHWFEKSVSPFIGQWFCFWCFCLPEFRPTDRADGPLAMSGWLDVIEQDLCASQKETELQQDAEACRSSSPEGDDVPVPMSPQTSDAWFVQSIKAATRKLHPRGMKNLMEHPVSLLSNCTGACSEGAALEERLPNRFLISKLRQWWAWDFSWSYFEAGGLKQIPWQRT